MVWNVNEKRPPGAIVPEFHAVSLAVDVCGTESALVHVTVVPTARSATSGLKAVVVNAAAPIGIDTDDDGPDGVGEGEGVGVGAVDEYPLPHAIVNINSTDTTHKRNCDMTFSTGESTK
jgi:hypothetical protein